MKPDKPARKTRLVKSPFWWFTVAYRKTAQLSEDPSQVYHHHCSKLGTIPSRSYQHSQAYQWATSRTNLSSAVKRHEELMGQCRACQQCAYRQLCLDVCQTPCSLPCKGISTVHQQKICLHQSIAITSFRQIYKSLVKSECSSSICKLTNYQHGPYWTMLCQCFAFSDATTTAVWIGTLKCFHLLFTTATIA